MAALQLGWQRGRSGTAEEDESSPEETSRDAEGPGETEPSANAAPADNEFRTTPSPKKDSDQAGEGGSE